MVRLLLAMVMLLTMFGGAGVVGAQEMVVFVGAEPVGALTVVNKGAVVKVVLPGNEATGHFWEVANAGTPVLALEGAVKYVPEGAKPGMGGRFTASFLAKQAGDARIQLVYRQNRGKNVPPERTYELPVQVSPYVAIDDAYRMLDGNGDERISLDEFLHAKAFPVMLDEKGHSILRVARMDRTGDGVLDGGEVRRALFEEYDRNHDGQLDRNELQRAIGTGFVLFSF